MFKSWWGFVLLVVLVPWWLSGFQFWGFHSSSAIMCYMVLPILAGSVPNLSLYGTSAVVPPCTAVDCVVSLCQFTKGLHNTEAALPTSWKNLTSLHSTLPFVHPWLPSSFLGSFILPGCNITREDSNSVDTCEHTIYHNITLFGQPWKR